MQTKGLVSAVALRSRPDDMSSGLHWKLKVSKKNQFANKLQDIFARGWSYKKDNGKPDQSLSVICSVPIAKLVLKLITEQREIFTNSSHNKSKCRHVFGKMTGQDFSSFISSAAIIYVCHPSTSNGIPTRNGLNLEEIFYKAFAAFYNFSC